GGCADERALNVLPFDFGVGKRGSNRSQAEIDIGGVAGKLVGMHADSHHVHRPLLQQGSHLASSCVTGRNCHFASSVGSAMTSMPTSNEASSLTVRRTSSTRPGQSSTSPMT